MVLIFQWHSFSNVDSSSAFFVSLCAVCSLYSFFSCFYYSVAFSLFFSLVLLIVSHQSISYSLLSECIYVCCCCCCFCSILCCSYFLSTYSLYVDEHRAPSNSNNDKKISYLDKVSLISGCVALITCVLINKWYRMMEKQPEKNII